jgi:hypothetical protein
MHDLPPSLEESISEARKSLDIGNYKSCVVMSRRALEGLLKFAHKRLLARAAVSIPVSKFLLWRRYRQRRSKPVTSCILNLRGDFGPSTLTSDYNTRFAYIDDNTATLNILSLLTDKLALKLATGSKCWRLLCL